MFQCVQPSSDLSMPSNVSLKGKGPFAEVRNGMDSLFDLFDQRLKTQEHEVADLRDFLKKRAELERKYSKDLEALEKQMFGKHKDIMVGSLSGSSVSNILRAFIQETREQSRHHDGMAEVLSSGLMSVCNNIISDVHFQNRQCKAAGQEVQENVLRTMLDLQNNNKLLQKSRNNYELSLKKLNDVRKEIEKLDKDMPKKEKRDKSKKYQEKLKSQSSRHERFDQDRACVIESQMNQVLNTEAANTSVLSHLSEEIADLLDCSDLTYHHHLKNLVSVYNAAQQHIMCETQRMVNVMESAANSLNARGDKADFLRTNAPPVPEHSPFQREFNSDFRCGPEDMMIIKEKLSSKVNSYKVLAVQLEKELEEHESELLSEFGSGKMRADIKRFFSSNNDQRRLDSIAIVSNENVKNQEMIIQKKKALIITTNKIYQEEAKYKYLKESLVVQKFHAETLPRPNLIKRKMKTLTTGLPTLFGGSLEEYFEATGEKIPLIIESCISYINSYGMKHPGIFRIGGAQVEITKFEEEFEKGNDPFSKLVNGNQINSVAGVFKSYLRKLKESLFREEYFDQLMNITRNHQPPFLISVTEKQEKGIGGDIDFVKNVKTVISQWSEVHVIVSRYIFFFLQDLTKFSEETQMDPFNLAVCLGPSICPIPTTKDLIQHTNLVNDLIKNFIIFANEIFDLNLDGPEYKPKVFENEPEEEDEDLQDDQEEESTAEDKFLEAVALHDYVPDDPKILSLTANERLTLYSKANADWWTGCKRNEGGDKVEGLIADNHIRILNSEEERSAVEGSKDADEEGQVVCRRHISFEPNRKKWEEQCPKVNEKAPDILKDVLDKSHELEISQKDDQEEDNAFGTEV